jgi:hypothetical protein
MARERAPGPAASSGLAAPGPAASSGLAAPGPAASSGSGGVALTIDCISRGLLLGEGLKAELEALTVPGLPQVGALTIGEIANNGFEFLEFHNKTTVLALLSEPTAA